LWPPDIDDFLIFCLFLVFVVVGAGLAAVVVPALGAQTSTLAAITARSRPNEGFAPTLVFKHAAANAAKQVTLLSRQRQLITKIQCLPVTLLGQGQQDNNGTFANDLAKDPGILKNSHLKGSHRRPM
jgi:hypothetical protein